MISSNANNENIKNMKHKSESDTSCNWCVQYSQQRIGTGTVRLRNTRMSGDHPNYRIAEISRNT